MLVTGLYWSTLYQLQLDFFGYFFAVGTILKLLLYLHLTLDKLALTFFFFFATSTALRRTCWENMAVFFFWYAFGLPDFFEQLVVRMSIKKKKNLVVGERQHKIQKLSNLFSRSYTSSLGLARSSLHWCGKFVLSINIGCVLVSRNNLWTFYKLAFRLFLICNTFWWHFFNIYYHSKNDFNFKYCCIVGCLGGPSL